MPRGPGRMVDALPPAGMRAKRRLIMVCIVCATIISIAIGFALVNTALARAGVTRSSLTSWRLRGRGGGGGDAALRAEAEALRALPTPHGGMLVDLSVMAGPAEREQVCACASWVQCARVCGR